MRLLALHQPQSRSSSSLTSEQEWVSTYNAAKAAGKIPSFAPATLVGGNPTYPSGTNTGENGVCSWTGAFDPASRTSLLLLTVFTLRSFALLRRQRHFGCA